MPASMLRQFVQVLLMGEALSLKATLTEDAYVDDPTLGRVGTAELARLGALWRDRGAARDPRWVALTTTPQRAVAEIEIEVHGKQGPTSLPVAVVAEPGTGDPLQAVRLYHSFWPLEGAHRVRRPVADCHDATALTDVVERYQDALAAGDVEAVISVFADSAYAREPAGGEWVHRGASGLHRFYANILSSGGIPLKHCTVTDDGTRCAIEYVAEQWGNVPLEPQAGVAVYERAGDRLVAARIYDDIDPPL